jgi:hypothetical protein
MRYVLCAILLVAALACPAFSQDSQPALETISVSRSDFDALVKRVEELERQLESAKSGSNAVQTTENDQTPTEESGTVASEPAGSAVGGRQLALPDISLIVQAGGKITDDKCDTAKHKLQLTEAELAIQGWVYPNVKADASITASPAEGEAAQVEEAYLSYLSLAKGLNFYVGQKHVAFGRSNLLHNHSWLYARQPLVTSNLVAAESLVGQGLSLSYLIPTRSKLFAQFDLGTWSNGSEGEQSDLPSIMAGPGANVTDRFSTARLWTSYPVTENSELELGGSYLGGKSNDDPLASIPTDRVHITGVDLSYRHFGEGSQRLLLRGEGFWRKGTTDSSGQTAKGYYFLADYRPTKYGSVGLLYDWSEFPQATDLHESALSLIYTQQFSEQYYMRLQGIHGSRPNANHYNELWLKWVWGVGPHTHNFE